MRYALLTLLTFAALGLAAAPARALTPVPGETLAAAPDRMALADFDGDGALDVALGRACDLRLARGNGDGTFAASAPQWSYDPCIRLFGGADAGDTDGDGDADLAWGNSVLLGRGDGTFDAPAVFDVGPWFAAVRLADLNGDGRDDVITAGSTLEVLLSGADGLPAAPVAYGDVNVQGPDALAVGDFDGDHALDVAVAGVLADCWPCLLMLRGNGDGTLRPPVRTGVAAAFAVAAGRLDGDARDDVAVTGPGGSAALFGDPAGALAGLLPLGPLAGRRMVAVTDADGSGPADIVSAGGGAQLSLALADRGFAAPLDLPVPTRDPADQPWTVAAGDLDDDGWQDLVTATNGSAGSTLGALLNTPRGEIAPGELDFGGQTVGGAPVTRTATVTGVAPRPVALSAAAVEGAGFEVAADGCAGRSLRLGETCDVQLRFAAPSAAAHSGVLRVASDAPGPPLSVALSGRGVAAPPPPPQQQLPPPPAQTPDEAPAPPAAGGSTPEPDTTPPRAAVLRVERGRLVLSLRRGVGVRLRCSEACTVSVELRVPAQVARRLRLTRGNSSVVVGRAQGHVRAGVATRVRIRFTARAQKRLEDVASVPLVLTVTARDEAGNAAAPLRRRVTLRR